ncbi:hypothetical protein HPB51_008370 [Rhipicephalus microplus]|uniref:THAP-type domain-containing protein n=1 Tax=Rhipicephalus microplus TaxID=6941 RepID=A0A9J6DT74_RHIMP|nr:hypothetical protein HPB51_008370 [Rhipicephalus microplus]
MPGCCAVGCSNKTEDGFSLYNIPRGIRNSARREVWLQKISREDFRATPSTRLCEEHFTPDQFEPLALEHGVKKLRRDAVPTVLKPSRQRRRTKRPLLAEMSPEDTPHLSIEAEVVGQGTLDIVQQKSACSIPSTASHAALLARINALERQLTIAKAKARVKERERKKLMLHLSSYISEDQFTSLHRSPRGKVWSKETLTKALKIRLSCGSRGYDMVKELGQPLPSQRTLQRHIEHCKFRPGLLVNIMDSLAVKVNCMTEYERHAYFMMNEMQITPSLIYDPSADAVLGRPTIPLADGSLPADTLATHGLVFMLGGVTTRWKQVIGYHLTGNCFHALSVKQELLKMIRACEDIGLKIDAVVSDMGGGNQALWRLFHVRVGKHSRPNCSATHP